MLSVSTAGYVGMSLEQDVAVRLIVFLQAGNSMISANVGCICQVMRLAHCDI